MSWKKEINFTKWRQNHACKKHLHWKVTGCYNSNYPDSSEDDLRFYNSNLIDYGSMIITPFFHGGIVVHAYPHEVGDIHLSMPIAKIICQNSIGTKYPCT
jgi:hypothetical protein